MVTWSEISFAYVNKHGFIKERICFCHLDLFPTIETVDSPFCTDWVPIYSSIKLQRRKCGQQWTQDYGRALPKNTQNSQSFICFICLYHIVHNWAISTAVKRTNLSYSQVEENINMYSPSGRLDDVEHGPPDSELSEDPGQIVVHHTHLCSLSFQCRLPGHGALPSRAPAEQFNTVQFSHPGWGFVTGVQVLMQSSVAEMNSRQLLQL